MPQRSVRALAGRGVAYTPPMSDETAEAEPPEGLTSLIIFSDFV